MFQELANHCHIEHLERLGLHEPKKAVEEDRVEDALEDLLGRVPVQNLRNKFSREKRVE